MGAVWGASLEESLGCAFMVCRYFSKSINHAICMIAIIMKGYRIPLANTMSMKSALFVGGQLRVFRYSTSQSLFLLSGEKEVPAWHVV